MIDIKQIDPFSLPSIVVEDRDNMPRIPAIYFAVSGNEKVLYIGRAVCLWTRWRSHKIIDHIKCFDEVRVAWLQVEDIYRSTWSLGRELEKIEKACIDLFAPLFNYTRLSLNVPRSTIEEVDKIMRITGMSKQDVFIKAFSNLYQEITSNATDDSCY